MELHLITSCNSIFFYLLCRYVGLRGSVENEISVGLYLLHTDELVVALAKWTVVNQY